MTTTTTTTRTEAPAEPTCQRCHQPDPRGLANVRGLALCGLCFTIAKARHRRS